MRNAIPVVVLLATLLLLACGGDDNDGGRSITANDLPQIILQPEDVEVGQLLDPVEQGDQNSSVYSHTFEQPPSEAMPGDIICISVAVGKYAGSSEASDAFDSVVSSIDEVVASSAASRREFVPVLGDESDAYRTVGAGNIDCPAYMGVEFDGITIYFRDRALLVKLSMYTQGPGATIEDAVYYADLQLDRITEFRASAAP